MIGLLRNSRTHIKFYSKLFMMIKYGLKNEIINLNVKSFFVKLSPNGSYELFEGSKLNIVFKSPFEMTFFLFVNFFVPNGYIIEYLYEILFLWNLWVFL